MNHGKFLLGLFVSFATAASVWSAEPTVSHFARFGTNKVHYTTAGKGSKTLVFVHGWSGNVEFWREQVPAVAGKAKVILIDLPGHGTSDKPQASYTMDFFGESVVAVMQDAKVSKATLIGHSMGVPVICRAYAKAPAKVAGLVAVDGLLKRPEMTREQAERFAGPFRGEGYRQHTTNFIHSMFKPGQEKLRDWTMNQVMATPQHVMSSAMEGMFGEGQPNWDLKKVDVPVLVINAPNPRWTAEYEAYVKGLSSKAEYRVIENTSHVLMLEKPAEFNAVFVELLQKHRLID